MNVYELNGIKKKFVNFSLNIDNCCFEKGNIYVITGHNGCGKSTLLNLLSFINFPSQGKITFQGENVNKKNSLKTLQQRRNIGYLMQNAYLFNMTVFENVAYGLKVRKYNKNLIPKKVNEILDRFSLTHLSKKNVHQISGGEAQKTAIARTIILDTDVLLLDEPTANVDKNSVKTIEDTIKRLSIEQGKTILVTTHDQDQAYRLSKNIISIINGTIKKISYENMFSGILKQDEDGLKALCLTESVKLKLECKKTGNVTLVIAPKDIILSSERFESSAINSFYGDIKKIEDIGDSLRVFIDTGIIFCALITHRSFYQMQLNIGKKTWVTFKGNSVKIIE